MTAFEICDLKQFMNKLLATPLFDNFLLSEAVIQAGVTYQIDGQLQKDFYQEEQLEALGFDPDACKYVPFSLVRNTCFDLMKGKNIPLSFRFVFLLSPENMTNTLSRTGSSYASEDVSGMFINLTFRGGKLMCTTGISYRIFSVDKTLDREWDHLVELFFKKHMIDIQSCDQ